MAEELDVQYCVWCARVDWWGACGTGARCAQLPDQLAASAASDSELLFRLCPALLSVQPPLEDATAARNQAVTAMLGGLAAGGLTAQEPAALRSSVQQAIEEAKCLPAMPPFVDYTALLADLQQWVEALQAATAGVSTARQAAVAATEDASNQLEAADQSDAPATYRLLWLRWGWAKGSRLRQCAIERTAEFGAA